MNNLNVVLVEGNLTRDPELKYLTSGTAVANFSIAVNRSWKKDGEWVNEASFFDVVAWGKLGEVVAEYLKKGRGVRVVGSLKQDRWEQDGAKRSRVKIQAERVEFLPARAPKEGSMGGEESPQEEGVPTGAATAMPEEEYKDDISF